MIGTRLGSWIIDKEIGRGGMGCVYLAHRSPTDNGGSEQSAIKILAAELAVDSGFLARFEREIDILRQLDHPNIVRFRESGQQKGHSYFVMEYVRGPSFETLLSQQGRMPWPEVLDMAWQIAPALKHAHDRGIIHRDLKPSNLLRTATQPAPSRDRQGAGENTLPDGRGSDTAGLVKLTDFGIASLFASPHLTVTGGIVGTAEYLSPEQASGKPVTRRSDLYSLGIVLYTLLIGRTPFVGEALDLLHKHRFAQFDRPARLVPEIPHELDEIICQLLEKDPDKRPGDAMVLFRQLDSLKRKLAYQATHAGADAEQTSAPSVARSATRAGSNAEGPATLMSRLMRQELERERNGGPLRQFLNRPVVLAVLLAISVGLIAWAFWPLSAETLYQRGAVLMQSNDPDDWDTAWDKYLGPLLAKDPDTPHRAEIEQFRQRYESAQATRQANRTARLAGPMSEAQWFYQEGLRLRQQGDEAGAQRVWRALMQAFQDVPSEGSWVRLAEQELGQSAEKPMKERQWGPVREAVRHARELREQGKGKEADAIVKALQELYRDDKQATAILQGE
ncbi:MAG TPA: serine/threonine-protein kinase [Gemmataceae bacterium]|nr:serine/threonine-protein kinase [Gemmataceae bacterium]